MAEYASLRKIEFELCGGNLPEKYKAFVRRVLNDRNLIPAADVAPVVHGRWASVPGKRDRICSRCQRDEPYKNAADDTKVFEYCPYCGAKMMMDGVDGNEAD